MSMDSVWLNEVLGRADLATADTFDIDGMPIELPRSNARGRERFRDWQRRVLPDLMPDSVQADAPERTPFRMLYALTSSSGVQKNIDEVFATELAPMEELFRAETRGQRKMTLAFHVLAVKAAGKGESDARGFTERTLLLLCRDEGGRLDEPLLRALIEQFRKDPNALDLAQKTVLGKIYPNWTSAQEPTFSVTDSAKAPEIPFDPSASKLFREDVRSLLGAKLPPADFFQQLNLLFILHLGLFQPRVAAVLNPQMEALFAEMEQPDPRNLRGLVERIDAFERRHPFTASLCCRAPDPEHRVVTLQSPARRSFELLDKELASFHFNLLILWQLRRLGEAYLTFQWGHFAAWRAQKLEPDVAQELARLLRGPWEFLARMAEDPDFAAFLHRATVVLAARFVKNQIVSAEQKEALDNLRTAQSGLHALRDLYARYNLQNVKNPTSSRAYRQGVQVTSSLLNQGEYGLVQSRPRVGAFFQVGAGILPLLLLLTVRPEREKAPVDELWRRLEGYGLCFDPEERERLLARLRAMGVYERFSDAGEAAYVRNLMTGQGA